MVKIGSGFILNPDLPERFAQDAPLNEWDQSTFYGRDEHGYVGDPTLAKTRKRST